MYYDKEFLKQLDQHRSKTIYARLIALTLDETPIETIEGRVTQGSVNIDGNSAVRRTCSLTMVAQNFNYNEFIWGLNTKFKLEIGLENTINSSYPSIIWFKQGTYFISTFNTARATNSFTISINGKDKMCALNGELGGALTSSVDFGTIEDVVTVGTEKMTKITKLPIKDIIRNIVHLYGGEPLHNIIINDLDAAGLELLEYRYGTPMYLYRSVTNTTAYYDNITLNGSKECYVNGEKRSLETLQPTELEMLVNPMTGTKNPALISIEDNEYYVAKIKYGDTAGYRFTELIYAGDLIGAVGESLTSILDKIKNMLGDFEYFYDIDGQFIFQKKRYTFASSWTPLAAQDEDGKQIINFDNNVAYTFSDSYLITTFNNNPDLTNLKNDYSVWGARQSVSGAAIPVHMRYVIDKKPQSYTTIGREINLTYSSDEYDWRELIYQMAKDYYNNTNNDEFASQLANANIDQYPTGKTGYENYYIDLLSFWRELYNPETSDSDNYYMDGEYKYWNKIVYESPQNLNFWFDFLDTEGELSKYSVRNIGCRPKAVNDSNVKAIYFRETPNIIFTTNFSYDSSLSSAYTYINAANAAADTMFSISAQGKSAKNVVDELLYKHSYCIASTTINTIPIYYLEPNTRIHVVDEQTKLDGYYNISKISIPLSYNGTMSITATQAADTI